MLDIPAFNDRNSNGLCRRDFLRLGALTLGSLTLADLLRSQALAQTTAPATQPRPAGPRAKAVIQLWMGGGPAQTDTFDPKPQAGEEFCGPLRRPVSTNVDGIQIGELLPLLAQQADKYSLLRSMTHPSNGHETASYIMQTGTLPGELVYPAMGAVVAYKKADPKRSLPPYISVPNPIGRFSEAGFLGNEYMPFATGGDPKARDFRVAGLSSTSAKSDKLGDRNSLLKTLDAMSHELNESSQVQQFDRCQQQAYELILGSARQAFDLSQEKDEVRDRYGRNTFGQSCLLARRLVENGVCFVTVNWGGWDTHKQHFERMREMLPMLDKGFSALLVDLSERGLLDSTIVMWYGEFGRTPKVANEAPWFGGRHHFCNAFSSVVAGGGFQGGKVVGSTDRTGEKVKDRPIHPWDLSASMYKLLGIDPAGKLPHPRGCVAFVASGSNNSATPASAESGAPKLLTEIM